MKRCAKTVKVGRPFQRWKIICSKVKHSVILFCDSTIIQLNHGGVKNMHDIKKLFHTILSSVMELIPFSGQHSKQTHTETWKRFYTGCLSWCRQYQGWGVGRLRSCSGAHMGTNQTGGRCECCTFPHPHFWCNFWGIQTDDVLVAGTPLLTSAPTLPSPTCKSPTSVTYLNFGWCFLFIVRSELWRSKGW